MQSKTSFFNLTLFKKNLGRYAPLWGLFLLFVLLTGPFAILRIYTTHSYTYGVGNSYTPSLDGYFDVWRILVVVCNFFYAILCAGLLFSYLHQARSAYMMHAFPLNRSTQFVTNVLTGLCFALIPYLLQTVLNVLASVGLRGQEYLWQLLLIEVLSFLFFFGLAVFCMMLSGNTIIAILSYFALNFVFLVLPLLVLYIVQSLCFGFDLSLQMDKLMHLAPIVRMLRSTSSSSNLVRSDWICFWVYAAIGCVLLVLSWLHYRVRHIEQAGETMAYKWARIAFLLVFTIACTLGLGLMLAEIFTAGSDDGIFPTLLIFCVIASFLGWFGAEMMLKRTVRVFRKRQWLGWVSVAIATVALLCGLRFDAFGIQRYVPKQENVQEMTLEMDTVNYGRGYNLKAELTVTDPALIQTVLEGHKQAYERFRKEGDGYGGEITVVYHLKNGETVRRKFELDDRSMTKLTEALSTPAYATEYYEKLLPEMFHGEERAVCIEPIKYEYELWEDGSYDPPEPLYCYDKQAVREALLQDAAEGNLPICFEWFGYDESHQYICWYESYNLRIPDTAVHTLSLFQ